MMKNKKIYPYIFWTIFTVGLFLSYYGVLINKYPVPPGDDTFAHLNNIQIIIDSKTSPFSGNSNYGLFYFIIISLSKVLHISTIQAMSYLAPLLIPLTGLALYALAKTTFQDKRIPLLAFFLFTFISLQPFQTYLDGTFPNIMSIGIIAPYIFICLIKALNQEKIKQRILWFMASALLLFLIAKSHHLSTLITFTTIAIFLAISVLAKIFSLKKLLPKILWILALAALIYILFDAFFTLPLFQSARNILNIFVIVKPEYPYFFSTHAYYRAPWNMENFGEIVSGIIFQFGFLGALLFLLRKKFTKNTENTGWLLITIWFMVYFIGAVSSWSGEPTRLGRDLALPASILASLAVIKIYDYLSKKDELIIRNIFIATLLLLSLNGFSNKLAMQTAYSKMVRFSTADKEAYSYLIDSGLSGQTKVIVREPSWQTVAMIQKDSSKFAVITSNDEPKVPGQLFNCYLTVWYNKNVWPSIYESKENVNTFTNNPELTNSKTFSDSNKNLSLLCKNPL